MSDQFWLTKARLKRIESHFPKSRGVRVPTTGVWSAGLYVIRMVCDGEMYPQTTVPIRSYTTGSFAGPAWASFIAASCRHP